MSDADATTLAGPATLALRREGASAWPYRAAVLGIFAAFNLVTFNRYFPLSEGWWETYGYLWNSGLRPYRDFDLAFTPLFTMMNAGLLRLFGDSFFAIRLLGVGVFLLAVLVLLLLAEQFFSAKSAAVGVLVATFFVIAEPQFIAKDYHVYQLLLVALALLLHARLAGVPQLTVRRRMAGTVVLGGLVTLVFLLKQNVGGLLLVAVAASLPLVERERPLARLVAFGGGAALTLVAALPVVSPSDWRQLLLANDAKGSLGTVFGRVFRLEANRAPLLEAAKLCGAWALARLVFAPPARWTGIWSDALQSFLRRRRVRQAAFLGLVAVVASSGNSIRRELTPWFIPVTLALLGVYSYRVARGAVDPRRAVDPRVASIVLPLAALAYANTTTAAFDFNGMHVLVALAIGAVLAAVEAWAPPRYWLIAALAFLIIVPEIVAAKLRVPYAWWGHRQPSVFSAVHESEYPQLRGIHVSARYRDTLNAIKHDVDTYARSPSDTFFFNMPMFYWLHGKLPPFRTVVHWFDVVSSSQMDGDLLALRRAPPRVVVALEPIPAAYAANRELRNTTRLPQEDFRDLMDEWVASRKYRLVRSIALPGGTPADRDVTVQVVVQGERTVGLSLEAALAAAGRLAAGLDVRLVPRASDVNVEDADAAPRAGGVLAAGDLVTVHGDYARVQALSDFLGVARGDSRDWHSVNVYVREDVAAATER